MTSYYEGWSPPDSFEKMQWLSELSSENGWEVTARSPVYAGDDLLHIPQPQWLLPPVWQQRQLSVIRGDSNTFKTFLMVDVAMSLATGLPWQFMEAYTWEREPMPVLVVEGEGADTVAERAQGWMHHRGLGHLPLPDTFMVTKDLPNLWAEHSEDVPRLMNTIAHEGVQMVFIDTLHATAPGANTNQPEDMNRIVRSMRRVRDEAKSAVCVIHHNNKSGEIGGSNVLFAAMDTVVRVDPDLYKVRASSAGPEREEISGVWVATEKQRRYPVKNLGKLKPQVVRYRPAREDTFDPETDGTTLVLEREGRSMLEVGEFADLFKTFDESVRGKVDTIWQRAEEPQSRSVLVQGMRKQTGLDLCDRMVDVGLLHEWEDGRLCRFEEVEEL